MWSSPQFPADLVTLTEKILNGKLHFLCSVWTSLIKSFPFDSNPFDMNATRNILNATIKYVLSTKKFKEPLSKAVKKFSNKVVN